RIAGLGVVAELGGEHHAVAAAAVGNELAQQALAAAFGVEIGSVDEVAAGIEVAVEHRAGGIFGRTPAPVVAERHGAEREAADAQTGTAEGVVLVERHGRTPSVGAEQSLRLAITLKNTDPFDAS